MSDPRTLIERIEARPELPGGNEERFRGYGVMGLPFASGHVLGLRRFPASSVGPGYTSVWHRDPRGAWTFYADSEPMQACTRYFGCDVEEAVVCDIRVDWTASHALHISMAEPRLDWDVQLAPSLVTRGMNGMGRLMPGALWHNGLVLGTVGALAGPSLRAGRVGLKGRVSNGQRFIANPRLIWLVQSSRASLDGTSLGALGPLPQQAKLGDFWIPQRGVFAIGETYFEPLDATRHRAVPSRAGKQE